MRCTLDRYKLVGISVSIWALFFLVNAYGLFFLENILGVISFAVLPGLLFFLSFRLKDIPPFIGLAMSVAFSLLTLMLVGLIGNFVLPKFGVLIPLHPNIFIVEYALAFLCIILFTWGRLAEWNLSVSECLKEIYPRTRDILFSFIPLLFVVQSAMGAISLNNGGGDLFTLTMLGEVALYLIFLVRSGDKLSDNTIATALSLIGLSLLLMTSLRGWNITGHDIQREFQVFQLAKESGVWSMSAYRDAYNACLSITILPTIFSGLLRISDEYIFKFLFQLFFAIVPGITYYINRFWFRKEYSVLATVYLIGFPTFFLDMPFLIRQEIAFLFYSLMIYILFESLNRVGTRRKLFMLFGLGVVLSHYSTTYTVIFVLLLTVLAYPLFLHVLKSLYKHPEFGETVHIRAKEFYTRKRQLTFLMVVGLAVMSFTWTVLITNTGGSLTRVLRETMLVIRDGFTEGSRSIDVVNLISFKSVSQQEQLDSYIEDDVVLLRTSALPGVYYDESAYEKYRFEALSDDVLPPTVVSKPLDRLGIDIASFMMLFGKIVAKLMMVLVPLGLFGVLVWRRYLEHLNGEIYLLAFASFAFVGMNMVLPVLSTEYGIYRALFQSLFVIALMIVIATVILGESLSNMFGRVSARFAGRPHVAGNSNILFPLVLAMLFFLYSTAFIPQVFGRNTPLLHLNNQGRYYDTYLIRDSGISGVNWLADTVKAEQKEGSELTHINIDHSSVNQFVRTGLPFSDGIFPGVVEKDAYVFATHAAFVKGRSTLLIDGDQVVYSYPIEFLDENKNLIYSNGSVRIYR